MTEQTSAIQTPSRGAGEETVIHNQMVQILDRYLADLQAGTTPDKEAILAAHPELADQLRPCMEGIDFVQRSPGAAVLPHQVGRYEIRGTLGRGAFGVVCLAWDSELNRLVAVKLPSEGRFASPRDLEQFVTEARTAAQLDHPGIVTIFDVFREQDRVVLVQQYIQGCDLRRHLEQHAPLDPQRAAELGLEIAEALEAAHRKGFIHRDLKPSNVLLDEQGHSHVADFGLALHRSSLADLTRRPIRDT